MYFKEDDFKDFTTFMEAEMQHLVLLEKYNPGDEEVAKEEWDLLEALRKHIKDEVKFEKKAEKRSDKIQKLTNKVTSWFF